MSNRKIFARDRKHRRRLDKQVFIDKVAEVSEDKFYSGVNMPQSAHKYNFIRLFLASLARSSAQVSLLDTEALLGL